MPKVVMRIAKLEEFQKKEFEELKTEINEELEEEEWKDVLKIIESHFPTPTAGTRDKLPASFAYFHLCRVLNWVKKKKIDMYITYRLLVRINQFIHMLAFRIHIAVAEILIRKHGLPNGTWGIKIEEDGRVGNIDEMIEKFEKDYEKIVRDIHAEGKKRELQQTIPIDKYVAKSCVGEGIKSFSLHLRKEGKAFVADLKTKEQSTKETSDIIPVAT